MLVDTVDKFSAEVFAPNADEWDQKKIFPEDALRQAASLGLGGCFASSDYGGSELSRFEGSLIFESLAHGCVSTAA